MARLSSASGSDFKTIASGLASKASRRIFWSDEPVKTNRREDGDALRTASINCRPFGFAKATSITISEGLASPATRANVPEQVTAGEQPAMPALIPRTLRRTRNARGTGQRSVQPGVGRERPNAFFRFQFFYSWIAAWHKRILQRKSGFMR